MTVPAVNQAQRLPRRRRSFAALSDGDVCQLVEPLLGREAAAAEVIQPEQGVNNRTYIVRGQSRSLVVKTRPRPGSNVRNSPQWPRYTQDLFGPSPDGDLSTLEAISLLLRRHGSLRTPTICCVDQTLERVPCEYVIKEELPGIPFGWDSPSFSAVAATQLGDHLGRLHRATNCGAFGIFASRDQPASDWWPRFARSYRRLAGELCAVSPHLETIVQPLERALTRARESEPASSCALICVDQSPTHYLMDSHGGIGGLVDIEAHLWAPRELELAVVELWVGHTRAFWDAYLTHAPAPAAFEQVRTAYWFYTWMEWCYCMHTLLHDSPRALQLEHRLIALAASAT